MDDGIGRTIDRQPWRQVVWGASTRLLAFLWLFAAVLAMPLVASAQIVASGTGAFLRAGDVSGRDGRTADPALTRQGLRTTPPADLRFTAERVDAKPMPCGPDPYLPPFLHAPILPHAAVAPTGTGRERRLHARICEAAQARAPPVRAVFVR